MSSKKSQRPSCHMCFTKIRTIASARSVNSPSVGNAYREFTGDQSAIPSDKVICSKCFATIRKSYRVKIKPGSYIFRPTSETRMETPSSETSATTDDSPIFTNSAMDSPEKSFDMAVTSEFLMNVSVPHFSSSSETFGTYEDVSGFPAIEDLPDHTLLQDSEGLEHMVHSFQMSQALEVEAYMSRNSESQIVPEVSQPISQPTSMASSNSSVFRLKLASVSCTQSKCFICRNPEGRSVVPKAAIKQAYTHLEIFIPSSTRCCRIHLNRENQFNPEDLERIEASKTEIDVSSSDFGDWLMAISTDYTVKTSKYISFEQGGVTDGSYRMLTGLEKKDFDTLHDLTVAGRLNHSANRTPRDALGMFLMIIRKNLTQDVVGFLFNVSQPVVSSTIHAVKDACLASFVPKNLGVHHITREDALENHTIKFVNDVFEKPSTCLPLIMDGTYFYIEKPGDFGPQSMTYSMHKHRNLLKCMLTVLPDGYILDAHGLYYANGGSNDANILKYLLEYSDLGLFQDEGDYCIFDRGFRDVVGEMESYGIQVYMPSLLKKGQERFTVEESTCSRKVTSCRWVVEAVNGRLKNVFKFFGAVIEAGYTGGTIRDFCKIACAILNKFYPPLLKNEPKHNLLALRMLEKAKTANELHLEIQARNITTRLPSEWSKVTAASLPDFPRLTMEELVVLVSSVYQLKIARKYIQETIEDSGWNVLIYKEDPCLLRAKIASRFQSNKFHQVFIKTDPSQIGLDAILGHCCTCKNGLRVVGCCSHRAAVLRYLCYERHNSEPIPTIKRRRWEEVIDAKAELDKLMSQ